MDNKENSYILSICDECGSSYYRQTSEMSNLCPECSHVLYGYENCDHQFQNDRCIKCFWDGSTSEYLHSLNDKSVSDIETGGVAVCDSYKFSDGRIIAFLKSVEGKLPNQTILEDHTGRRWKIKQYFWSTGSVESYEKISSEEAQNIFQYLLEGIDQNEKPAKDLALRIIKSA